MPRAARQSGPYNRERDLPRLIRLWPDEVASDDPATLKQIVRKLHAALRAERQRGLSGHWTYDLARHSQLVCAYRTELQSLKAQRLHQPERTEPDGDCVDGLFGTGARLIG